MHEVRAIQPGLKVILISGQDPGTEMTAEAFAFLAKPFKAGPLVSLIQRALTASEESS